MGLRGVRFEGVFSMLFGMWKGLCPTLWLNYCSLSRNKRKNALQRSCWSKFPKPGFGISPPALGLSCRTPHFSVTSPISQTSAQDPFQFHLPWNDPSPPKVTFLLNSELELRCCSSLQGLGESEKKIFVVLRHKEPHLLLSKGDVGIRIPMFPGTNVTESFANQDRAVELPQARPCPLSSEQNEGGGFYRARFSCQSTRNYLQPWAWGCECKENDKMPLKALPESRIFIYTQLPALFPLPPLKLKNSCRIYRPECSYPKLNPFRALCVE